MKLILKSFLFIIIVISLLLVLSNVANAIPAELNPLKVSAGTAGINEVIGRVIKAVLGVIGAVALLMIVAGGMFMLTSAGNQEKVKKGKDILTWSIISIMAIIGSYMMVDYIIIGITQGNGGPAPSGNGNGSSHAATDTGTSCSSGSKTGTCFEFPCLATATTMDEKAECVADAICPDKRDCFGQADCAGANQLCCQGPNTLSATDIAMCEARSSSGGSTTDCTDSGGQCVTCAHALGSCFTIDTPPCPCTKAAMETGLGSGWTCEEVGASTECGADTACCKK